MKVGFDESLPPAQQWPNRFELKPHYPVPSALDLSGNESITREDQGAEICKP